MATSTMPRAEVLRTLMPYAQSSNAHGLALFLSDMALYLAAMAGALFLPQLWMQILSSIYVGVKMGNLLTLAHDAAHNTLVKNRRLNWWLGVFSFLTCWYSYRMWVFDHHVLHHAHTNNDHKDTYTPYSKAQFDALPQWKQAMERFYRQPNPVSFAVYYIVERWSQAKLFPNKKIPADWRASAWKHCLFVCSVLAIWIITLINAPHYSHNGPIQALVLGLFLPFFSFMAFVSFMLWAMHTHPQVAWYQGGDEPDPATRKAGELVSVNVRFPRWLAWLMHDVMDHPVHHLCPAIPCYRLHDAQKSYNDLMGDRAIVAKGTWAYVSDTMRRCKLYDFETNRWLDWNGRPTSELTKPYRDATLSGEAFAKPLAS